MAQLVNLPIMLHLSGGFGFVYSMHYTSCVPNLSPWQEYKDGVDRFGHWFDPPLKCTDSAINIPKAPGLGLADPKEIVKDATAVTS